MKSVLFLFSQPSPPDVKWLMDAWDKEVLGLCGGVSTLWGGGGSNIGQWGWVLLSECNPPCDPCVRLCLWQTIFFVSIGTALGLWTDWVKWYIGG